MENDIDTTLEYFELVASQTKETQEAEFSLPDPSRKIQVMVILFWNLTPDDAGGLTNYLTREEFDNKYNTTNSAFIVFKRYAQNYNLQVYTSSEIKRYVSVKGKVCDFERAFSIKLKSYTNASSDKYISYTGSVFLPKYLENIVQAIIGFDDRSKLSSSTYVGMLDANLKFLTPQKTVRSYGFSNEYRGKNKCIALLQFGGGYLDTEIQNYFKKNNLQTPELHWVSVDGVNNSPASVFSRIDLEVAMNIEVAGSVANDAKIVTYFAPNTEAGFLNAFSAAVHDKTHRPDVISVSWGAPECNWSEAAMMFINEICRHSAMLGITICVAAGNRGLQKGIFDNNCHVDFPTSSPFVLSCGGTSLRIIRNTIIETPWCENSNEAGGTGISRYFPKPDYQNHVQCNIDDYSHSFNGRVIPDVSGNASPRTGYLIYSNKQWQVVAGTSSVAPLYAGLIACFNEQNAVNVGFINPLLYKTPSLCRQVSWSQNTQKRSKCQEGSFWHMTTGLGVLSKRIKK